MAIGQVKAGSSARPFQRVQAVNGAFGEQVGKSLGGLSQAVGQFTDSKLAIEDALKQKQQTRDGFGVAQDFIHFEAEQQKQLAERLRAAPADGGGVTQQTTEELAKASGDFMANVPQHLRDKYQLKMAQLQERQSLAAFSFENKQGDAFFSQEIKNSSVDISTAVSEGTMSFEQGSSKLGELINSSDLPELQKQQLARGSIQLLRSSQFTKEARDALSNNAPAGPTDGKNPVAPNLAPYERAMLNAISADESGGDYSIRYGGVGSKGKKFTDFTDHPRVRERTKDGRVSTAAGRYMITAETWDEVQKTLHLPDFSPVSQDRAAIYLARKRFNDRSGGLDFDTEVSSGDRQRILNVKNVLDTTWVAFRNMKDDKFANIMLGSQGIRGGGTSGSVAPNIWNDPRFTSIPFDEKTRLYQNLQKQVNDQQSAIKTANATVRKKIMDDILVQADLGNLSAANVSQLEQDGTLNHQESQQAHNAVQAARSRKTAQTKVREVIEAGGSFTRRDIRLLNDAIGQDGKNLIGDANPEYLNTVLKPMVAAAGFIPTDALELLSGVVAGNDPRKRENALTFLSNLGDGVVNNSIQSTSKLGQDVTLFKQLKPFYTSDELMQKFTDRQDPNKRQAFDKLGEDAGTIYDETVDAGSLVDTFDPGFLAKLAPGAQRPDLPVTEEQLTLLSSEHKALFVEGYKNTQNVDQARAFADAQIKQHWSTSSIGYSENFFTRDTPPRIVRDGVANFYQDAQVDGSLSWINQQVRDEIGISNRQQFQLIADAQTVQEGDRYKRQGGVDKDGNPIGNASYKIAFKDKQGGWSIARADDRSILRLNFEQSHDLKQSVADNVDLAQASAKAGVALTAVLKAGMLNGVSDGTPEQDKLLQDFNAAQRAHEVAVENSLASLAKVEKGRDSIFFRENFGVGHQLLQVLEKDAQRIHDMRANRMFGELSSTTMDSMGVGAASETRFDDKLYNELLKKIKARGGKIPEEPK